MLSYKKHINPLVKDLDWIDNYSDLNIQDDLEKDEYPYLQRVVGLSAKTSRDQLKKLEVLEKELEEQIKIIDNETGKDKEEAVKMYNMMFKKLYVIVERLDKELSIADSPYFGKLVIDRKALPSLPRKTITSYIGKFGYFDKESKEMLITDWRAPIANVYYINSGPTNDISYTTPVGEIKGDLLIKRQFEISRGRINHIYDAKSGNISADQFLLAQLKKRLGKKLTEIVATIQSQQNSIIRDELNKTLILQGVAGSGKTTIVLHRLAYLFYTYPEKVRPEQTLIVAPNRMFLDYISDVLPSLGVSNVEANTYIFWAKKILGWNEKHTLSNYPVDLEVKREKGGIEFIQKTIDFFNEYEKELLENIPYSSSDVIMQRYFEIKEKYPNISLLERLKLAVERAFIQPEFDRKITGSYTNRGSVSENVKKKVDEYVRKNTDIRYIYKKLVGSKKYLSLQAIKYSKETFKRDGTFFHYTSEDLAPLIWIFNMIQGNTEFAKEYIVVDEAQDMTPFEIYTLYLFSKRQNLFLAGDLAQSIIPPFYIKSWDEIINMFKKLSPEKFRYEYHQLNRCYRTTIEIIEFANNIFRRYFPKEYKLPEAVLRHGDKVKEIVLSQELERGNKEDIKKLAEIVNKQFELNAVTVAIICKDDEHALRVFENLKKQEEIFSAGVFTYSDNNYQTGILVLPISKAKGLEFDSVFLADVNKKRYTDNELDIRLLYVAVTRPLHRLFIIKNRSEKESIINN